MADERSYQTGGSTFGEPATRADAAAGGRIDYPEQRQGWGEQQAQTSAHAQSGAMGSGAAGAGTSGAGAAVGSMQAAGDNSGSRDDAIDTLDDLAQCCLDGEQGFKTCAEHVKDARIKQMMLTRAAECRQGYDEIRACAQGLGGKVSERGSAMGAIHRGWTEIKSAFTRGDLAMLEECERGEDNALARYRKASHKPLPAQVAELVRRQMGQVQANHDKVKAERDAMRARESTHA